MYSFPCVTKIISLIRPWVNETILKPKCSFPTNMRGQKVLSRMKQNPLLHCQKSISPVMMTMMMTLKVSLGDGCQSLQSTGALHSHFFITGMLLEYEGTKLLTKDDKI